MTGSLAQGFAQNRHSINAVEKFKPRAGWKTLKPIGLTVLKYRRLEMSAEAPGEHGPEPLKTTADLALQVLVSPTPPQAGAHAPTRDHLRQELMPSPGMLATSR